jgi:hypothetical protein
MEQERWTEIERVVLLVDGEERVDLLSRIDKMDVQIIVEREATPRVAKEHRREE